MSGPAKPQRERRNRPAALNLHLQQLLYLREVALRGSITSAAEALHVSQPALSQALAELTRRLNVPLFERSGRSRRLTEAGQEALRFAEETLARASDLERRLEMLRCGTAGLLSVGMIDAASLYVLPDVIRRYRDAYPDVELRVIVERSADLLRRLRSFELDIAFVVGPLDEADLVSVEILREPLTIYGPLSDSGPPESARWVLYPTGSRTRRIIDQAFARLGLNPSITLESDNPAVLHQMVVMGLGWSVLPPAVGDAAPSGVRQGEQLAVRPIHAARRKTDPPDARANAFLSLALERSGRSSPDAG
jgi:DNA-binding transcriptional LysR family regulator